MDRRRRERLHRGVPVRREADPVRPGARRRCAVDFLGTYVDDLPTVVDIAMIKEAGVRIGADPLGGAAVDYWGEIADRHGIELTVVNPLSIRPFGS